MVDIWKRAERRYELPQIMINTEFNRDRGYLIFSPAGQREVNGFAGPTKKL